MMPYLQCACWEYPEPACDCIPLVPVLIVVAVLVFVIFLLRKYSGGKHEK